MNQEDIIRKHWRIDTGFGKEELVRLLDQITLWGYKTEDRFYNVDTEKWVVISYIEQ